MKFVAVDVETANPDMGSICSIGAATFNDGQVTDEWYSLINPDDDFSRTNVSIHGIDKQHVKDAPSFALALPELSLRLDGAIVVTHTHFDRVALHQASARWDVALPSCVWLDSSRVVRRTWEECAHRGYGLADVCRKIGYAFNHHNALEDAKAAGHVLLAAMAETDLDLDALLQRVNQPINLSGMIAKAKIFRDGNPDGPLSGEVVVFTGALQIPRRDAADLAAAAGCDVIPTVTKKATLIVVGDTDARVLAGHEKSSKHRKAEELIAQGQPLRIIRETDFLELINTN